MNVYLFEALSMEIDKQVCILARRRYLDRSCPIVIHMGLLVGELINLIHDVLGIAQITPDDLVLGRRGHPLGLLARDEQEGRLFDYVRAHQSSGLRIVDPHIVTSSSEDFGCYFLHDCYHH